MAVILEVLEFTLTRLLTGKAERAKNAVQVEEELNVVERSASRMSHVGVARDIENCCNCECTRDVFPIETLSARKCNDIIAPAKRITVLSICSRGSYCCLD